MCAADGSACFCAICFDDRRYRILADISQQCQVGSHGWAEQRQDVRTASSGNRAAEHTSKDRTARCCYRYTERASRAINRILRNEPAEGYLPIKKSEQQSLPRFARLYRRQEHPLYMLYLLPCRRFRCLYARYGNGLSERSTEQGVFYTDLSWGWLLNRTGVYSNRRRNRCTGDSNLSDHASRPAAMDESQKRYGCTGSIGSTHGVELNGRAIRYANLCHQANSRIQRKPSHEDTL